MTREVNGGGGPAEHAGHVEDVAAVALLHELPERSAVGVHHAREVQLQGVLPAFVTDFVERSVALAATAPARDVRARPAVQPPAP